MASKVKGSQVASIHRGHLHLVQVKTEHGVFRDKGWYLTFMIKREKKEKSKNGEAGD